MVDQEQDKSAENTVVVGAQENASVEDQMKLVDGPNESASLNQMANFNVLQNEKGINIAQAMQIISEVMTVVQVAQQLDSNTNGQADFKDLIALVTSLGSDWTSVVGKLGQIKTILGGDIATLKAKLAPATKK